MYGLLSKLGRLNAGGCRGRNGSQSLWSQLSRVLLVGLALYSAAAYSAADEVVQSRIIVKWKTSATRSRMQAMSAVSNNLRSTTGIDLTQRHSLSERMDAMELDTPLAPTEFATTLAKLNAQADVEFAVADERRFAHALPNDPLFTATSGRTGQWYLNSLEVAATNALNAWNYSTGGGSGSGVIVAVVDTGVRYDHPDLLKAENGGKLLPGYDFVSCDQTPCSGSGQTFLTANDGDGWDADASDPGDWVTQALKDQNPSIFGSSCSVASSSWHGTRVAGIIGAETNNGIGIAGTGYNARILPVRVLGRCGGYDSDIIAGMRWAAGLAVSGVPLNPTPAKIINLSLGSSGTCSAAYSNAITEIRAAGVSIVASAGNDSAITNSPANCNGVIGVAGVRNTGTKVGFSSLGTAVAISAPGGNCVNSSGACLYSIDTTTNLGTTTPGVNDYTDQTNYNLGTSFSAPIVSGTIALMLGANSSLTPNLVTSRLKATVTVFPTTATNTCTVPTSSTPVTVNQNECNCTTSTCGAGIVNAYKAVLSVAKPSISITGAAAVTGGQNVVLDASASTAADGHPLSYVWSIGSGSATLSGTSAASTTLTVPDTTETVVVNLTITDDWSNTASQSHSIEVTSTSGSSSSVSSSSSSSSAGSTTSSNAASSAAPVASSSGGGGGGAINLSLVACLSALFVLRRQLARSFTR
jgi:serine protease